MTLTAASPDTAAASAAPPRLQADGVRAGYAGRRVLDGVDLRLEAGTVTALVGPNGSGKSTLLRACTRLLGCDGSVLLDGQDLHRLPTREVARRLAVLPQAPVAPRHLTVRDLVEQGRYAQVGPLRMLRRQDHAAIDAAIDAVGLRALAAREVDTLSGGERQRAWIALTLAQETPLVALDEPTTFLDVGHQLEVLELVRRLNRERALTVVMVLHDLNHAASFADRVVALDRGAVVAAGEPWEVVTPALLADVFGVDASVIADPRTGAPVVLAHGCRRRVTGAGRGGAAAGR